MNERLQKKPENAVSINDIVKRHHILQRPVMRELSRLGRGRFRTDRVFCHLHTSKHSFPIAHSFPFQCQYTQHNPYSHASSSRMQSGASMMDLPCSVRRNPFDDTHESRPLRFSLSLSNPVFTTTSQNIYIIISITVCTRTLKPGEVRLLVVEGRGSLAPPRLCAGLFQRHPTGRPYSTEMRDLPTSDHFCGAPRRVTERLAK